MLRKFLFFSAISSSFLISPIAKAETSNQGLYFTAGVGTGLETQVDGTISADDDDIDRFIDEENLRDISMKARTTFGAGIGLGYNFGNRLRLETLLTRSTGNLNKVESQEEWETVDETYSGTGLSLGLAYDFENDSRITPYVGASYLLSWPEDEDDVVTSYGIDLGISTPVSEKIEIFGAVGLSIVPEQTIDFEVDDISLTGTQDAHSSWGFKTGLRIKL